MGTLGGRKRVGRRISRRKKQPHTPDGTDTSTHACATFTHTHEISWSRLSKRNHQAKAHPGNREGRHCEGGPRETLPLTLRRVSPRGSLCPRRPLNLPAAPSRCLAASLCPPLVSLCSSYSSSPTSLRGPLMLPGKARGTSTLILIADGTTGLGILELPLAPTWLCMNLRLIPSRVTCSKPPSPVFMSCTGNSPPSSGPVGREEVISQPGDGDPQPDSLARAPTVLRTD